MKRFIRNTLLFFILFLSGALLFFLLLELLNKKVANSLTFSPDKTVVFIGDSHVEAAIIDSLLPGSINQGLYSESPYFSYFKLKAFLKTNPSVRNVYLSVGYHTLSSYYDEFIDGQLSNLISSRYFYLLPLQEQAGLLLAYRNEFFPYVKTVSRSGLHNLVRTKKTFQGGFANAFVNTMAKEESMKKRIAFQFFEEQKLDGFSERNILYLRKILELCKSHNINLTLINTPLHPFYKANVPKKFIDKYEEVVKKYQLNLIDLTSMPLPDSCYIQDGDHVSQKGAVETTKHLLEQLRLRKVSFVK